MLGFMLSLPIEVHMAPFNVYDHEPNNISYWARSRMKPECISYAPGKDSNSTSNRSPMSCAWFSGTANTTRAITTARGRSKMQSIRLIRIGTSERLVLTPTGRLQCEGRTFGWEANINLGMILLAD